MNGMKAARLAALSFGEADGDAAHIAFPSAAATENTSLSPRPERQMAISLSLAIAGAVRMMWATACADSSAGVMPSELRQHQ